MPDHNDNISKLQASIVHEQDDRFSHYEYYRFASSTPVCFRVDKSGFRYGASLPAKAKGSLEPDATFLSKRDSNPDEFHPIDKDEFEQRVRDFVFREIPKSQIAEVHELYRKYLAKNQDNQKG